MNTPQRYHQTGVAVIAAMLLAALTTIIVGQLIWEERSLITELENQQEASQALWISHAAVQWSRTLLAEDMKTSQTDHLKEVWARKLPLTRIEGAKIKGEIIDQQQYFNLNSVGADSGAREALQRLLAQKKLPTSLASALADWVDTDDTTADADGAESIYYQSLAEPYMAANQPLTEIGNAIKVKGMQGQILQTLKPFVSTLPVSTELNVNTAPAEVLAFVLPDTNSQTIQNLIATRNVAPFQNMSDFKSRMPPSLEVGSLPLSTKSQFFTVRTFVEVGHSRLLTETLLFRDGPWWPTLLWQRIY